MPFSILPRRNNYVFWFRNQLGPFWGVWVSTSSKECETELIIWAQLVLIIIQMASKAFWENQIFTETGRTRCLSFWSNFDHSLPPEDGGNQKESSGYEHQSKWKPYLLSIFIENHNYFLLYLGYFGYKYFGYSLGKHEFFKNLYQRLVIGETSSVVTHFKLALFQL